MLDTLNLGEDIKNLAKQYLTEEEIVAIGGVIKSYHEDPVNWLESYFSLNEKFFQPPPLKHHGGFVKLSDFEPKDNYQRATYKAITYCNVYYLWGYNFENITRDYVRRVCDYVENSAKYLLATIKPGLKIKEPLGKVINALKNREFNLPRRLLDACEIFNQQVYTKAKHEYDLPVEQHLYTVDEAILIYFMGKKLGTELQSLATKTC